MDTNSRSPKAESILTCQCFVADGNDKNFEWLATMPTGTSSEFSYKLKICPDQESQFCGGNMAAGCQTKSSDAAFAKRIGTYDNKLLRY